MQHCLLPCCGRQVLFFLDRSFRSLVPYQRQPLWLCRVDRTYALSFHVNSYVFSFSRQLITRPLSVCLTGREFYSLLASKRQFLLICAVSSYRGSADLEELQFHQDLLLIYSKINTQIYFVHLGRY